MKRHKGSRYETAYRINYAECILSLPNLQPVYIPTDIVCMNPVYNPYTYMYELACEIPVPTVDHMCELTFLISKAILCSFAHVWSSFDATIFIPTATCVHQTAFTA